MNMVWAYGQFTGNAAGTDNGLQYHTARSNWTLNIKEDGTATSGGDNGIVIPVSTSIVL